MPRVDVRSPGSTVLGNPVFLKNARLPGRLASGRVVPDPLVTPIIRHPPALGVQVQSAIIESRNLQVGLKVDSLATLVRIGLGGSAVEETFVA